MKVKYLFPLLLIIITINGCGANMQGVCRHQALYCASVAGEKYPVRIAVGKWHNANHVQTQALLDGRWENLGTAGNNIVTIPKLKNFKVIGYMNIEKYSQTLFKNQVNNDIPEVTLISP